MTDSRVWLLADHRAGNVTQCRGVADALGVSPVVKEIRYNRLGRLPNWLLGASTVHLVTPEAIAAPWPELVIAAGRRTAPVARYVKRRCGAFLVQCMWPGPPCRDLDLIAVPEHDAIGDGANVLRTIGAPHRVTRVLLDDEAARWRSRLVDLPEPRIAVLIGGGAGLDAGALRDFGGRLSELAGAESGSLLVTTSPRTAPMAAEALFDAISVPAFRHAWQSDGDNPYLGILGIADAVVVTGDSTAMCSEACATGGPVYIHPPASLAAKHERLHRMLYDRGFARPLAAALAGGRLERWHYPPLNPAEVVAAAIRARLPGFTA